MKLLKKTVSILLTLTMMFGILAIIPLEVNAAGDVTYIYRSWNGSNVTENVRTCTNYTNIHENISSFLSSGWYVANDNVTIDKRLYVNYGTVNIILCDDKTLTLNYGITVGETATLNIFGQQNDTGKLECKIDMKTKDHHDYAVIGGDNSHRDTGNIHIYGGSFDIDAGDSVWDYRGACIGGGVSGAPKEIVIYGGNYKLESNYGACIGGGSNGQASYDKDGGIRIYGGKIRATSFGGAAIGNGAEHSGSAGGIEIYGGRIQAYGKNGGASIGGGGYTKSGNTGGTNGPVTIYGGTIVASGTGGKYTGAGIGSGQKANQGDKIRILGGNVSASSASGAGIGAGAEGNAKTIEILGGTVIATATAWGAGIGGGREGNAGEITIKNATVTAESSNYGNQQDYIKRLEAITDGLGMKIDESAYFDSATAYYALLLELFDKDYSGAAIGGGHKGSGGKITIIDSTVTATSGNYAAGIGGGDDVSGGIINITNATIKEADSKTDGAGIGGGESGHGGTITIKNSNVTAHGGGYAAGIGGGDSGDGGTITINNSTVKAYGGTDAAGIGGGEDGDGGHIEIVNHSDVYAEGSSCGAGIGGGEDSDGEYCQINNDCTVEAISGGYGNVQAIGHGDCGWYVLDYTGGWLYLGKGNVVYAGKSSSSNSVYGGNSRFDAIWSSKYVKVLPCDHQQTYWVSISSSMHSKYCPFCGVYTDEEGLHHFEHDVCTVCGAHTTKSTLTLHEQNNSGSTDVNALTQPINSYCVLPECENVPGGKEFTCWYSSARDSIYFPGDVYRLDNKQEHLTAVYFKTADVRYIDAYGKEQTTSARIISNDQPYFFLTPGWYVVNENIDSDRIMTLWGEVNLILADGKTYKANPTGRYGVRERIQPVEDGEGYFRQESTLTLYGQKQQTGTLDLGTKFMSLNKLVQYGGNVTEENSGDEFYYSNINHCSIINGRFTHKSKLSVSDECYISAGHTEIGCLKAGSLQIGWNDLSDSIRIGSIESTDMTIKIDEDLAFTDGKNIYTGTLTGSQVNAIKGKTLTPYLAHNYAEPEWIWDNEYKEATAVFRCKDCADVRQVKAKATYKDSGNNRTSTARCLFNGQEYKTTQTFRIIYDVTVAKSAHGTVTVNKKSAVIGDNIKLEVTADDGYTLSELYYTDSKGKNTVIEGSNFAMPESNVTVHAIFTAKYTVTWKNGDTILEIDGDVPYGTVPSYDGTIPTKADNENDTYLFAGWSPEISKVTGDITYTAQFAQAVYVDESEPYIDENGEYILGHKAHYELGGKYYAANKDRTVGEQLDSIVLSYFDFKLLDSDTYQINYYTGPTDSLTELVIPKTFGGKPVTVLGNDITQAGNEKCRVVPQGTPAFTLVLNENITEIKPYSFYAVQVTTVTGNTSNLSNIGSYAFSWANSGLGYALSIKLDYPGKITAGFGIFNNMNVTAQIKHETTFSKSYFGQQSIGYVFTDAHTYGEPVWDWDEDYIGATVTRTCTHPNCKHTESTVAAFAETEDEDGVKIVRAVAVFDDVVYHDVQPVYKAEVGEYIVEVTGRFKGGVDSGKHNMVSKDGFKVVFMDKNGNKVNAPQYIWVAKETASQGIVVEPNGDVAFTKEGGFNVQLRSPDGKIIYSPWIPVRAFRGGDDGLGDLVDNLSSAVISTKTDVPKTGDISSSAAAAVLLTSLTAVLFLAMKRRKGENKA